MTDNELDELLQEMAGKLHVSLCMNLALVQMLIDKRVLKGGEEKILEEMGMRVDDTAFENLCEIWVQSRVRNLLKKFDRDLDMRKVQ